MSVNKTVIIMKKVLKYIFLLTCTVLVIVYFVNARCPRGMSPGETVEYYFNSWDKQNYIKMNSVVGNSDLKEFWFFNFDQNGINLIECSDDKTVNKEDVKNSPYKNPYDTRVVRAAFKPDFKSGYNSGLTNQVYEWNFYLQKKNKSSDWKIVGFGAE